MGRFRPLGWAAGVVVALGLGWPAPSSAQPCSPSRTATLTPDPGRSVTVTWGNEKFHAFGTDLVYTSGDGRNWMALGPSQYWFFRVRWLAGQFIAVGLYGRIATSPDGLTWTDRNAGWDGPPTGGSTLLRGTARPSSRWASYPPKAAAPLGTPESL